MTIVTRKPGIERTRTSLPRPGKIQLPKMVDVRQITPPDYCIENKPGACLASQQLIKVAFFARVMAGHEFTGYDADSLRAILADPKQANKPITSFSLNDLIEFERRLNKLPGGKGLRAQRELSEDPSNPGYKRRHSDYDEGDSPTDRCEDNQIRLYKGEELRRHFLEIAIGDY
jgi:hypothetical protein